MYHIAVAGKGGSGKSTLAGMLVRRLAGPLKRKVFAVDADPNANLGLVLGVEVEETIADIRDGFMEGKMSPPSGMSKTRAIEYEMNQIVQEEKGFDLLTMGRPEGPACYCYVNNLLRDFLGRLTKSYDFMVTDNEAGMEHLSRRTTDNVDLLLAVAEPTLAGIQAAGRIFELVPGLPIEVKRRALVLNKLTSRGVAPGLADRLAGLGQRAEVPFDEGILARAEEGKPLNGLPADSPAAAAVAEMFDKLKVGE